MVGFKKDLTKQGVLSREIDDLRRIKKNSHTFAHLKGGCL
jgi:hypothetical protein